MTTKGNLSQLSITYHDSGSLVYIHASLQDGAYLKVAVADPSLYLVLPHPRELLSSESAVVGAEKLHSRLNHETKCGYCSTSGIPTLRIVQTATVSPRIYESLPLLRGTVELLQIVNGVRYLLYLKRGVCKRGS